MKRHNGLLKFQPYLVSAFGVIAIDSKKSKTIDLYSDYAKKTTGACLIDHKSRVQWATELELVSHELGHSLKYSFWPKCTLVPLCKKTVQAEKQQQ